MRTRTPSYFLAGLSILALGAFGAPLTACSSSSGSTPSTTSPSETIEELLGEYTAAGPGIIHKVTFSDATHYSMIRGVCANSENICIERGTYALSSGYDSVSFTEEKTGSKTTMPFKSTRTASAGSLSSERLHTLGGISLTGGGEAGGGGVGLGGSGSGSGGVSIIGGDGGVGVCLSGGGGSDGGVTLVGVSVQLVFSFSLGGQSFSGGVTISLGGGSGGCPSEAGAGSGGGGGGGGGSDAGSGSDATTGGGGGDGGGGTGADASAEASSDGGSDANSGTYPAFTPYMPQVVSNGSSIIASPQIVTITWPGDSNASTYESFGDAIGGSSYWTATTSEYGVGPATSGASNHIRMTETPAASMSDADLQTFVINHATTASTSNWPAPSSSIIYVLYLPSTMALSVSGSDACAQGIGGYHNSATVNGAAVAYAILPHCSTFSASDITLSSSHELIEASTDAVPGSGYVGFGDSYLAWDILQNFQDEIADACEDYAEANTTNSLGTQQSYGVQRSWTNHGAAAGHALCLPTADATPYYNVTPLNLQTVSVNSPASDWEHNGTGVIQTQGYSIKSGQSATFQVGFYSDAATSGPWTLSAVEGQPAQFGGGAPAGHLTISIDKASGQNGDQANVTVQVNSVDTSINGELITFQSQLGSGEIHYMPVLISNQ